MHFLMTIHGWWSIWRQTDEPLSRVVAWDSRYGWPSE